MRIKTMTVGALETNMYIVIDDNTYEAVIIDPSGDAVRVERFLKEENLNLKAILVTHGHFDHVAGTSDIKALFDVPVIAHKQEAEMMEDSHKNLSIGFSKNGIVAKADTYVTEGEVVDFGGELVFKCIEVPGHSPNSICYYSKEDKIVFTGDTLMAGVIGRMDFYDGPQGVLIDNIKSKLLSLPEDTVCYPGHGGRTKIDIERKYNSYLKVL